MSAYGLIWLGARASSRIVAIGFLMLTCSPAFAAGKTQYDALMEDGYAQLKRGETKRLDGEAKKEAGQIGSAVSHFDQALACDKAALRAFQAAENAFQAERRKGTPKNAVFFQGVALNEMGQTTLDYKKATVNPKLGAPKEFCAAIYSIERSIKLGMTPKDNSALYFELGWALVDANNFADGIPQLDRFLRNEPIEPSLKARAEELRSLAEDKIEDAKESAKSPILGNPIEAKNASPMCGQPTVPKNKLSGGDQSPSVQNESQFQASLVTGIGYDWNVSQLGRTLLVPSTLNGKGAFFNETNLSLEGDWFFYHNSGTDVLIDKMALTYAVIYDAYDGHSSLDSLGQAVFFNYCRAIALNWCLGFQAADTWLRDDTQNISNTFAFGPSVIFAESDRLATQLSYGVSYAAYFTPSTPATTLDGFTHRISLVQSWILVQRGEETWSPSVTLSAVLGHEWTLTEGVIGDRQRDDPLLKVEWAVFSALDCCSFVRSITLSGSYQFRHDQYGNASFPSLTADNRFARRDDTQLLDIALSVKMIYDETMKNRLEALLEYKYTTDYSNVPADAYDEPRLLASVKLNF
jgi:tetratricopeptide (TPR) repeat protein